MKWNPRFNDDLCLPTIVRRKNFDFKEEEGMMQQIPFMEYYFLPNSNSAESVVVGRGGKQKEESPDGRTEGRSTADSR
jgi:hypothetical protein